MDARGYNVVVTVKKAVQDVLGSVASGSAVYMALAGLQLPSTFEEVKAAGVGGVVSLAFGAFRALQNWQKNRGR